MAKTYNSKRLKVSFSGVLITGLAEGDNAIEVTRNQDAFTLMVGADGESARAANPDNSGRVTIRLMQTSASNDALSALHERDRYSNVGQAPLFIGDATGTTVISAQAAWIVKVSDIVLGAGLNAREWVFETGDLQVFSGSNL